MINYIELNFEKIFNAYYKRICYFLNLYSKDAAVIEDIVQDVFCRLWEDRHSVQPDYIGTYLHTVARNRVLNYLRDVKLHEQLLASWMLEEKELAKAYECVDEKEFEKVIHEAVDSLSPKCKQVFSLSRFKQLTYKEIAQKEGISEKMVEKHISTALKKIKKYILNAMPQYILFLFYIDNML